MIKCGFAQNVFTPADPTDVYQDGYGFRTVHASGVHDDLYVKAAAFEDADGNRFGIVVFDVCGMNRELYETICSHVEEITGLPRSHFAVCATHTHASVACKVLELLPLNYDVWSAAAEICAQTLKAAFENAVPCRVGTAIASEELRGALNRRMREPIDRRIKAAVFTDGQGALRGCIASASCHPVINTTFELSADYPGILTERALGEYGVPFLFLQGRGADINPTFDANLSCTDAVRVLGNEVADKVFEAVGRAKENAADGEQVKSAYRDTEVPVKPLESAAYYENAVKALMEEYRSAADPVSKHCTLAMLKWNLKMKELAADPPLSCRVPLQVMTLGTCLAFAFLPFELLTLTGNRIEAYLTSKGFAPENVFVIGYANSVNSYLPPVEEFAFGGYEVDGATQWYGMLLYSEKTEPVVIEKTKELFETL